MAKVKENRKLISARIPEETEAQLDALASTGTYGEIITRAVDAFYTQREELKLAERAREIAEEEKRKAEILKDLQVSGVDARFELEIRMMAGLIAEVRSQTGHGQITVLIEPNAIPRVGTEIYSQSPYPPRIFFMQLGGDNPE